MIQEKKVVLQLMKKHIRQGILFIMSYMTTMKHLEFFALHESIYIDVDNVQMMEEQLLFKPYETYHVRTR